MSELLETRNLTKSYDKNGRAALCGVNITIPRGRIIGLLGPNGSGKTTLIKLINGLLTPTEGSVLINGEEPGVNSKSVISYLSERPSLPTGKKVSEIIDFYADFYADFDSNKAYEMLESLQISGDSRIKTLSKGTKEKVQLIMVMSRNAELYILDEPIAGVDPAARDYIIRTIITNYSPDSSVLLSTHLISDVENVLDDVIFIKDGNIVLSSSVEDLRVREGKSLDTYFREVFAC